MKRFLIAVAAIVILGVVGVTSLFVAQAQRRPRESVELSTPGMSPAVISPDIPTFVTFTTTLTDPNVKHPKLQFFDPAKGKWKAIGRLRDDGKFGDSTRKDGTFSIRISLLDSAGMTTISLPKKSKLKIKGQASSPIQIRLAARKKGQPGLVVSPSLSVLTVVPSPVDFAGGSTGPPASVDVPATFSVIDASDPTHVVMEKSGADGYQFEVYVRAKPSDVTLESWIFANALGFTSPGDPSSFADYPDAHVAPVTFASLSGLKVEVESEGGSSIDIFLDDTAYQRVIWFSVNPLGAKQEVNISANLPEALSIVESLQH